MPKPLISICIPAYKRTDFLKKLLDSIRMQEFRDFEVVLTDDSPVNDVKDLCTFYTDIPIIYHKNIQQLGTPENWNEGIRKANGEWIKLMHDDDWFSHSKSLGKFAEVARTQKTNFLFSSYTNYYFEENREEVIRPTAYRLKMLKKDPLSLLSSNIVGPPSVVMHRNDGKCFYDRQFKWLVDIDFYNQRLKQESFYHIDEALVHVGLSEEQVTRSCHYVPEVEIPENFYLLMKTGTQHLKNIFIYDAWWRLFRNLGIKNKEQLLFYGKFEWPPVIYSMLKDEGKLSGKLLNFGPASKFLMTLSYYKNRSKIK